MESSLILTKSIAKNFMREKGILILLIALPIVLIFSATSTVPDQNVAVIIEGKRIFPDPNAKAVSVILYALTAVGFVASIASFFINHQIKTVQARLRIAGYSSRQISTAFLIIASVISTIVTASVVFMGLLYITPENLFGFVLTLVIGSIIFSTIGLILSTMLKSKELGLYLLLTIVLLDTGFIEHPFYSKQYNNKWLVFLPAHYPVRMILRASFTTGNSWLNYLGYTILYELILLSIFLILLKIKK